jgi:hypothetical protein
MVAKLKAVGTALAALFSKATVDSLISDVEQRVEHLALLADAKATEQKVHQDFIAARVRLLDAAKTEETRARVIAAKFKALISSI